MCKFLKWRQWLFQACLWFILPGLPAVAGEDFAARLNDRAAIERVYYNHRLGTKPPFEETLPRATLENLVRLDLTKEAALQKACGVTLAPAQLAAEVQRINTTTRAPEILADIKAALGHDDEKFANAFAKPILVERELRQRFDNDDALHAPQRREMERVREQLLNTRSSRGNEALTEKSEIGNRKSEIDQSLLTSAATNGLVEKLLAVLKQGHSNEVSEAAWQLGARPEETPAAPTADEIEIKKRFGANAQIISPPHAGLDQEHKIYFQDLPAELQKVLRAQLRQAGDVSAVIETPGGFLLYVAKEKTDAVLSVASLSLPKRSYEQWLEEQAKE